MFGLGKSEPSGDKLSVQVHVVAGDEIFKMAQKLWNDNARAIRLDEPTGKEYLHFGYQNPKCVVWFQRDHGRTDIFEVIVRWEEDKTHEILIVTAGQPLGNATRAQEILNKMLTTPSVVPSSQG